MFDELKRWKLKVTCDKKGRAGECITGKIRVPGALRGKEVIVLSSSEVERLDKLVSQVKSERAFFSVLLNAKNSSRMFSAVSKTWNPVTGCQHNCTYCWARRLAETKLKNTRRYRNGFKPAFHRFELSRELSEGIVFVTDMGDLFGEWVPKEWILEIIGYTRKYSSTFFLFLTKNPSRYHEFMNLFPENAVLGATIETNRDELTRNISKAPPPSERYQSMKKLNWPLKFISVEPVLDFDLEVFTSWIRDIDPFLIYVGYDNYNNKLPEPPLRKVLELIGILQKYFIVVKKSIRPAWYESLGKSYMH